jgi:hypothetical protein
MGAAASEQVRAVLGKRASHDQTGQPSLIHEYWNPEPDTTDQQAREITGMLQPRTKELLALPALHPDSATRETLISALWGQDPRARPTSALHTALSRMSPPPTAR